jgi:iron uptake system component EfeO
VRRGLLSPAAVLAAAVLAGPVVASAQSNDAAPTVQVTLTNDGCTASPAGATAGPLTFRVTDTTGDRVSEVELVKDDVILGEKESLFPGASGSFSVDLPAGSYELYCPGAATEKTPFEVAPAADQAAPVADPQVRAELDQAVAAYRAYVQQEAAQLVVTTQALVDAVNANQPDTAKQLYPLARAHYERIEPIAESFRDLDAAIDMREDDVTDPTRFTGFHRLEKALWQDGSLDGMAPIAQQLAGDTQRLQQLVNDPAAFSIDAARIANGAAELLDEVARTKVLGEEERYSHLDLVDIAANVQGARAGLELLQGGLARIDPTLSSTIAARLAALDAAIAPYQTDGGWVSYTQLGPNDVRAISRAVDDVAEPVSQVAAKVVAAGGGQPGANAQP